MSGHEESEECARKFINTSKEIIRNLEDLNETVKEHRKGFNIAKTAATTTSAVGTACVIGRLFMAPFTFGASLTLSGIGIATTVGGAATGIGTEIVGIIKTKKFAEKIKSIAEKRNAIAIKLHEKLKKVYDIVEELKKMGVSEDDAFYATIKSISKNAIHLGWDIFTASKLIKNAIIGAHLAKNLASAGIAISTTTRLGVSGAAGISVTIGKAMADMTAAEMKAYQLLIKNVGTKVGSAVSKNILKGVTAVTGIVFTVVDVAFLIRDSTNDHPTTEAINDLIQQIQSEMIPIKMILRLHEEMR